MPHKTRRARQEYQRAYHDETRPAPAPEPQGAGLPPYGELRASEDGERVQCHVCGEWRRSLVTHIRVHGLDAAAYKEAYDLPRGASLWSPATQEKQRAAALARDQGAAGREVLAKLPPKPREPGISVRLGSRVRMSRASRGRRARPSRPKVGATKLGPITAEEIRALRNVLGVSQDALADRLGVHAETLSRWERGEQDAPSFLRLALERLLSLHARGKGGAQRYPKEVKRAALDAVRGGEAVASVARRYGITLGALYRWVSVEAAHPPDEASPADSS